VDVVEEPKVAEPKGVEPNEVEPKGAEPNDDEPNDDEPNEAEPNEDEPNVNGSEDPVEEPNIEGFGGEASFAMPPLETAIGVGWPNATPVVELCLERGTPLVSELPETDAPNVKGVVNFDSLLVENVNAGTGVTEVVIFDVALSAPPAEKSSLTFDAA